MATLDSNIILQGQPVNLLGAMQAGQGLAAQRMEFDRQREYQNMLAQNGAGILAGDAGAMNALAGYDPAAAMNIQNTRQSMQHSQRNMDKLSAEEARSIAEYKRKMSAEEAAAEATRIEQGVKMGLSARSPQEWDAMMAQVSPDMVGMFDRREMLANRYMTIADILKRNEPPQPLSSEGKLAADVRAGLVSQDALGPKPTNDMLEFQYAQKTPGFAEFQQGQKRAGATTINTGGGSDKQVFDAMAESAASARSALQGQAALKEAKAALQSGIISGAGADMRLGMRKVGAYFGITDPAIIQNTETFRSAIAPQVAALMKATVGSTQISNADREFAEKAAGGSITLDAGTLTRLVGIMEKAGEVALRRHAETLDKVYPTGQGFDRERALFGIAAQEPIDPPPSDGPVTINSDADYDALPSGATFRDPEGNLRRKP